MCTTWDVYVCDSLTKSKERGVIPSSSIIEAFLSLSPAAGEVVRVYPANWKKQIKAKGRGHTVRCVQRKRNNKNDSDQVTLDAFEVTNVDSVDKVYRIITEHMKLQNINPKACECLNCYIQGNERLEEGQPSQAINLYNQALSIAREDSSGEDRQPRLPEGSILMRRSRAYLKRAANHRKLLQILVKDLADAVPEVTTLKILYQTASTHPSLAPSIYARLAQDSKLHQSKFRSIRYRHDMYEFALLHAAQDSLQATQLLPSNSAAWSLAGQCLADLRKLNESSQYFQKAMELDPSMEKTLRGMMEKNRASQEFIDVARGGGLSADTLRLALDVAG
ncbi:hypothetical protein HJC23_000186 [Cyclotella cryptica]|uniref:Uncharacterized protein n=1 Tax=Cyclotella cryptica TaxID=29204 RepID=A0ABD3QDV9_9STRA